MDNSMWRRWWTFETLRPENTINFVFGQEDGSGYWCHKQWMFETLTRGYIIYKCQTADNDQLSDTAQSLTPYPSRHRMGLTGRCSSGPLWRLPPQTDLRFLHYLPAHAHFALPWWRHSKSKHPRHSLTDRYTSTKPKIYATSPQINANAQCCDDFACCTRVQMTSTSARTRHAAWRLLRDLTTPAGPRRQEYYYMETID